MTLVSNWLRAAGCRPAERVLVPLILQELAVLIEDRVGPQVGLEDVGARHRDLEELRAEVEAALQRDVDGLIERQAIGRSVVVLGAESPAFRRTVSSSARRAPAEATRSAFANQSVPAPPPGVEIDVGMPLGVETPGRPPRIPPVPGKLPKRACRPSRAPAPGASCADPGSAGTLVSTVGRLRRRSSAQRPEGQHEPEASNAARYRRPARWFSVSQPVTSVKPIFRFNPGLESTGRASFQSVTSLDPPRPQQSLPA